MTFKITQTSPDFADCRADGRIDYDVFVDLFRELSRLYHGRLHGVRLRCDVSASIPAMDFGDEVRIVDYISQNQRLFEESQWAFIADSPQTFELGKIGKILVTATNLNFQMDVFDSPEKADAWLGESAERTPVV